MQLKAAQFLDDASLLAVSGSAVAWGVISGPIVSVNDYGLATSGTVYQTSLAIVSGSFEAAAGTLALSIVNVDADDYGSYANDGLPDEWQEQYFGLDNPDAAPNADASGTGQTNYFKYIAGLNPVDPASVFRFSIQKVTGDQGRKALVFSPVVAGRSYNVVSCTDLSSWSPLTEITQDDHGDERTVTDLNASGEARFYRVLVSKP